MSGLAVRTTPLPESKLRSSVPSTSTRLSSQIDPPTPSAATSSRPGANRPTSDSARNQTSSLAQSVDLLDKLPVPAKQSKSSHHTPSTNVTSASAKPTENLWELGCGPSATGILRVSWIQIRQIKQYPMLLSAYTAAVTSFAGPQKWVERILPNLDSSALSSLAPHPLAPGYPSEEFPQFDEPLAFEMTLKTDAHPWIKDGTLEERYEALEDAEKRAVKRLAEWKQWIKVAKPLVQELLAKAGNTSAPQQTNTASIDTPQSTRSLVKKRRRISKEGGDRKPGPSTPNLAGRVVTDNTTIPIARTAITLQGIRAQSRSLAPGPAVNTEETQLPASPERNPIAALDLVSTAKKKKAKWNLLSPKKKCKRETIPDHATFSKEPANVSPAIHGDPRPAASRGDSNPESVLEREPDTLESTEGEPDTLRSSSDAQARSRPPPNSHSPQKIDTPVSSPAKNSPPWSSSTVANDLVEARPRPPFSPSYAAKMHKKAVASSPTVAATTSPRPSPSARAPLQPSPSRRSRSTRSTSSSPRKAGLPMPPSAQPVSRSRETGEDCSNRGLLFGQEGATSPQKTTPKEVEPRSPAGMRIKMEETENNPFLISPVDSNNFMKAASLAEGSKRKSAGNDEQRHSKKAKKSKKIEHDEDLDTDVKPVAYESDSEDNGVLSMGSPDEEGRRLWKKKVRSRLHAKVVEGLQAAKSPQLQVEINPDRNQGQKHAFKQTERKKSVRQTMTAEACGNCQAYYERKKQAVPAGHCNHVHAQDQGSRQKNKKTSNYLYDRADEIDKRMQQDGRHRVAQRTVPDPPDYWQMGFPDTQQIEGINLRAKQQKAELEQYKRIEAEKSNGLYRFRNETS
ncbi:uncharacterized protein JCM15063_002388 [Sporobolomyces koalae]|uniref:uncharacterized protein n=1 Tax=Sporobolomyces koalae TaxID=500713 RepID=UPI003181A5D3